MSNNIYNSRNFNYRTYVVRIPTIKDVYTKLEVRASNKEEAKWEARRLLKLNKLPKGTTVKLKD